MGIELKVRNDTGDPEDFRSTDACAVVLQAFCDIHHIPYSDVFVSIAVSLEGGNLKEFAPGHKAVKYQLADEYGENVLTLKVDIVKEIEVVCAGDFQTTVCNAVARSLRGENISDYLSKFTVLSGKTTDEKMAELEKAAAKVRGTQYAEARIHRRLKRSDDRRF